MIMGKVILMLSMMFSAVFVSCSVGKKNPLVGTWVQDEKSVHLHHEEEMLLLQNIVFMEDGSGVRWFTSPEYENNTPGGGELFKWSATESQIDIYAKSRKTQLGYAVINGQLIVYDENNSSIAFNRVSDANIDSLKKVGMFKPVDITDIIKATKLPETE